MSFKTGDKIVCPMYGAGQIEDLVKEKVNNQSTEFYKISLIHSNMELLIPVNMSEKNGLRKISKNKELTEALMILDKDDIKPSDEDMSRVVNELNEIIKQSTLLECAEWMSKLLYRRRNHGQLNSNEKKLYLNFKSLICGELALIKKVDYKEAEKSLDKILKKNSKLNDDDIKFLGLDKVEN
jgi:CarD family transcriptional regulator